MTRSNWKYLLGVAVLAVVLSSVASQADAQWWGCCRPCVRTCYAPCYTACYTPCYSPCVSDCGGWYLGYRPGPVRRWVFGPYRWYYGYGCGCGYSCGGACGGCCATSTPCCSPESNGTTTPNTPTPAKKPDLSPADQTPMPPQPAPTPSTLMPKTTGTTSADQSGILTVWVPYEAKVTINGHETKSTGSRRQFVSYGLQSGLSYKYVVKAQLVRDGQLLEDTQTVVLTAGQVTSVAFGFNTSPDSQVAAR